MSFTARAKWRGSDIEVAWGDGRLSGDKVACDALEVLAWSRDGQMVGFPTGPTTESDHLSDPFSTLYLMVELFGSDMETDGDVPMLEDVPDGAVA